MDYTALTTAVDFTAMTTAAMTVGGAVLLYVIGLKGIQLILSMVRRA